MLFARLTSTDLSSTLGSSKRGKISLIFTYGSKDLEVAGVSLLICICFSIFSCLVVLNSKKITFVISMYHGVREVTLVMAWACIRDQPLAHSFFALVMNVLRAILGKTPIINLQLN